MSNFFGEHLDLNQVSAVEVPLAAGFYDLQVRRIARKEFVYKNGPNTGKDGARINIRFVVTNDAENSGHIIDHTLWGSKTNEMYLKRLQEATGIEQTGTVDEWAEEVSSEAPIVRMFLLEVPDRKAEADENGDVPMINILSWKDVLPGGNDTAEETTDV